MQVYVITPTVHEWLLTQAQVQVIATIEDAKRMITAQSIVLPTRYTKDDVLCLLRSKQRNHRQRKVLLARIGGEERWHSLLETYRDTVIPRSGHPRESIQRTIITARVHRRSITAAARLIGYNRSYLYEHEHEIAVELADWLNGGEDR